MQFSRVDLPDPLAPIRPVRVPRSALRSMFSHNTRDPKDFFKEETTNTMLRPH